MNNKDMMVRLFVAVTLPEEVRDRIQTLQEGIRHQASRVQADLKWVRPEQFHLTLKFLGECAEDTLPAIHSALQNAASGRSRFTFTLGGVGVFPELGSPKIIWLGTLNGGTELVNLAGRVVGALTLAGFPAESKAFHPHLTLARPKDSKNMNKLKAWVADQPKDVIGEVPVSSIVLIQSVLSQTGPTYTELKRFTLTP